MAPRPAPCTDSLAAVCGWLAGWLGVQKDLCDAGISVSKTAGLLEEYRKRSQALADEVKDLEQRLLKLGKVEE